jgi:hypothetical protein
MFGLSLLSTAIICGAIGLVAGWFLLPAPKFIVNLWSKLGLVDRVP